MKRGAIIIGAGLGGLNAAVALAQKGFRVQVFEKNDKPGGKLNLHTEKGFSFDLGPSILTLPGVFEQLFASCGKRMADYVPIEPVLPHWRNFFEDGTRFDFHPDVAVQRSELQKLGPGTEGFLKFLAYSQQQFELCRRGYFDKGYDTFAQVLAGYSLPDLLKFDNFRSMDQSVRKYVSHSQLVEALNYFVKYVGSSPYDAPGLLNLMPYLQFAYGLWYVRGGMYNMARGLEKLAREQGVEFYFNAEVTQLRKQGRRVSSVVLKDGREFQADYIVSNLEVLPAYRRLLQEDSAWTDKLEKRFEPACSGMVLHLGVVGDYAQLAHHNFFYSNSPREHFSCVFHQKRLSPDPTIYLVCPTQTDKTLAPQGHCIIKILPHIPHLQPGQPISEQEYASFKERVLLKLERMGLTDLRKRIVVEQTLWPADIERLYYSNKGSIYGVVSNRFQNQAFRFPKRSDRYDNLFFVGGSVNPGCGMPMVALSGQHAARLIAQQNT